MFTRPQTTSWLLPLPFLAVSVIALLPECEAGAGARQPLSATESQARRCESVGVNMVCMCGETERSWSVDVEDCNVEEVDAEFCREERKAARGEQTRRVVGYEVEVRI